MARKSCLWALVCSVAVGGWVGSPQTSRADVVYTWGRNDYGQLGDGSTKQRNAPVPVSGLGGDIISVAAGSFHSLALRSNGTLYAWGANSSGQVGDGTNNQRVTPMPLNQVRNVATIAGGGHHSLALLTDGTIRAWGNNEYAQMGDGTVNNIRAVPVPVSGLANITAIAGGTECSLALAADGTAYAWGTSECGQLGDSTIQRLTPGRFTSVSNITAIAAGDEHTLLLRSDGTVYACGRNEAGQLGDGTWNHQRATLGPVTGLSNITAIACGYWHNLALRNDGTVYAWGSNVFGEMGDGGYMSRNIAAPVSGLSDIVEVAASEFASYALAGDGSLWAWGWNDFGQLGLGDTTDRYVPTRVQAPTGYRFTSIDADAYGSSVIATLVQVPEPGTLGLLAVAGVGLLVRRRGAGVR